MLGIPERTSSKRAMDTLEGERDDLNHMIAMSRKKLKPQASFSSEYWSQAADIARQMQQRNEVQQRISIRDLGGNETEWQKTPEAQELFDQLKAQQVDEKMCERQAQRLKNPVDGSEGSLRRSFIQLFTTSKLGLGITSTGAGKRDSRMQSTFRSTMIEAYNSRDPNPLHPWLWCPILSTWVNSVNATAAHLFAYMHGQDVMNSIFGPTNPPELFSALNGLIVSSVVESVFDKGFLVIVPRISNNPSIAELLQWNESNPKEYKIRIIDLDNPTTHNTIQPGSEQTWKDLDSKPVEFRNEFRPRARYLYFHYCMQMLRLSWKQSRRGEVLKKELGGKFWGTPGRYLPRNMLLAFVEEMGHEYEELLEGAAEEGTAAAAERSDILLAVAMDEIKAPLLGDEEDEDEDNVGEDEEGDNEGYGDVKGKECEKF
ncbi:MAG: hypothetical protein M1839_005617 [Geoglossum umbratile]|nr:MAG: hypothetical protein M1839_005617 [Geoglossum umbratile]